MEAKGNDSVLIKQESIIAKLRRRLKLDQQTAKEILESPEIEYEALGYSEEIVSVDHKGSQRIARSAACLLDLAIQQGRVVR